MAQWYYLEGTEQRGPVLPSDFDELVYRGTIRPETYVWREGMAEWLPYGQVAAPQPPPPPPLAGEGFPPPDGATGSWTGGPQQGPSTGPQWNAPQMGGPQAGGPQAADPLARPYAQEAYGYYPPAQAEPVYAGFWIRLAAKFVDNILLAAAVVILASLVGIELPKPGATIEDLLKFMEAINDLNLAVALLYTVLFLGRFGATPGKMAMGIKVVRPDGRPIGYLRALGRFFAEMVSQFLLLIGYLMAAFDGQKRTLHDRICDTRVVRK